MSSKLTQPMRTLIENYTAGAVATVNEDGTPAVSPKATFVVIGIRGRAAYDAGV